MMSSMDASQSDVDFDSYWDEEARNPNRNRIRIGRQYQAQCPSLLKTGESDGRNLKDLETLTWNPNNALNSDQLNQYFAIAKSIGLFIQAIDTCQDGIDEIECLEEEKCLLKPFEILDSGTKCILEAKPERPVNNNNNVISSSPEKQSVTTRQRLQQQNKQPNVPQKSEEIDASCSTQPSTSSLSSASSSTISSSSISPLKQCSNTRIQSFAKGLPAFILSHHTPSLSASSEEYDKLCQFTSTTVAEQPINLGSTEKYSVKTLAKLLLGQWNDSEAKVFAQAIKECGKNFSAIKKDYLPWKSVRSIIEFYYLTLDKEKEKKRKLRKTEAKTIKHSPENNKKNKKGQSGNGSDDVNNNSKNDDENNKDSNDTSNDNDNNNNADSGSEKNDQQSNQKSEKSECSEKEMKDELFSSSSSSSSPNPTTKGMKNGNICSDLTSSKLFTNNNSNMNGNNSNAYFSSSPEAKQHHSLAVPGQEIKPIKAKPILSQNETVENRANLDSTNKTNLGSLNLYLNGELVLRLNAQQQESGQKWVESMDMPLKRKPLHNGYSSSRSAGMKRSLDPNKSFKEDPDDISLGGSGSDDDSLTSNESSSLVASSPSSSSTITAASTVAKKARVKVENNSLNGNSTTISSSSSSPNSNGRKCEPLSMMVNGSNSNNSKSSIGQPRLSPLLNCNSNLDNNSMTELDFKKKLFEYYQMNMGMSSEEMQLLLTSALFVDPPKAHSNSLSSLNNNNNNSNGIGSLHLPVKEKLMKSRDCLTPPKTTSPSLSNNLSSSFLTNGFSTNGFMSSGPVDLTRKSPLLNNHHSNTGDNNNNNQSHNNNSKNQSPSKHKSSSFSLPRAAHESSRVSPSSLHHPHRSSSSSLAAVVGNNSPFSLPAPPPPPMMISQSNMSSVSPNNKSFGTLNNSSPSSSSISSNRKSSSIRGSSSSSTHHHNHHHRNDSGIHQYAK